MDIAIVAIGYNRPLSMKRLYSSLAAADYLGDDVTLYISLDKGEKQSELISDAEAFNWPFGKKIVRSFPEKQGLKKHVLQCGDLVEKHDAIIVLEDDIIASPCFYNYVKQAVAFYGDDSRIAGISLISIIFYIIRAGRSNRFITDSIAFLCEWPRPGGSAGPKTNGIPSVRGYLKTTFPLKKLRLFPSRFSPGTKARG